MNLGERLHEARESLHSFYDQLNRKWREAEEIVRSIDIPCEAWVRVKTLEPDEGDSPFAPAVNYWLAYVKCGKEWRICYGAEREGYDDVPDTKPILECSLEERIEAMKHLPRLLESVVQAAEKTTAEVEQAVAAASEALVKIRPSTPK